MQTLATNDTARARVYMQTLIIATALIVMRTLVKLDMITIDKGYPRLSLKGRDFLRLRAW